MDKILVAVYFGLLVLMSIITLCVFAKDKKNSKNESNGRIPEIVLLSLTAFGGAPGALIGMYVLRHKTDFKTKYHFAITVWCSIIVQAGLGVLLLLNLL